MTAVIATIVTVAGAGRWRFHFEVAAEAAEPDDDIEISGAIGKTSRCLRCMQYQKGQEISSRGLRLRAGMLNDAFVVSRNHGIIQIKLKS